MQYMMSPVNPDQVIPLQTNRISTFDGNIYYLLMNFLSHFFCCPLCTLIYLKIYRLRYCLNNSHWHGIRLYVFPVTIVVYVYVVLDLGNQIEVMSVEERLHDEEDEESVPITGNVPASASAEEVRGAPIAPVSQFSDRTFQHSDTTEVICSTFFITQYSQREIYI